MFDADSHVLEPKDWLTPYADPGIREQLRPAFEFDFDQAQATKIVEKRAANEEKRAKAEAKTFGTAFEAYGAFDRVERSSALDRFGFAGQLVFSTFAADQFLGKDLDLVYGGTRAHNRAMADFCAEDPRLIGVGYVPLRDPARARVELEEALALGCGTVLIPAASPNDDVGPAHPDIDPIWAHLEETGTPFMLHVGATPRLVPKGFRNNGRPLPPDMFGGGESLRSKDYLGITFWPEFFLSVLALDGVFERFPGLRCGCIEQGAEWVVTMLPRIDRAQRLFKKNEPDLAALPLPPSEYIRRQVKFTPFPEEDVGWIIDQIGPELVMFSSDFPHPEGGRDPLAKFEASLADAPQEHQDRFYATNFEEMMGVAATAA